MKRILIASDSFKGTLSSQDAGQVIRDGVLDILPHASVEVIPLADGGEGTVDAILEAIPGDTRRCTGTYPGPLANPIEATYGLIDGGRVAILEMAATAGLGLIDAKQRDPLRTSTYGTGLQFIDAIESGATRILIGIGGSSTNDGGTGFAQACGVTFYSQDNASIPPPGCAATLNNIYRLTIESLHPRIQDVSVEVLCDVDNPLCGPNGATFVYGPQKFPPGTNADPTTLDRIDNAIRQYAGIITRDTGIDILDRPGAGAAGGLGGALMAFTGATLRRGIDVILDIIDFDRRVTHADLVITGEGRLDGQSVMGKAVSGVAGRAKKSGAQVIAIAGCVGRDAERCRSVLDAFFGPPESDALSMETTEVRSRLRAQAREAMRSLFQ